MTLGRCVGSGVWGVVFIFLFRYGNPVDEARGSPQPQFGVGDMWRVYVECVLLMAGLQPHLA